MSIPTGILFYAVFFFLDKNTDSSQDNTYTYFFKIICIAVTILAIIAAATGYDIYMKKVTKIDLKLRNTYALQTQLAIAVGSIGVNFTAHFLYGYDNAVYLGALSLLAMILCYPSKSKMEKYFKGNSEQQKTGK